MARNACRCDRAAPSALRAAACPPRVGISRNLRAYLEALRFSYVALRAGARPRARACARKIAATFGWDQATLRGFDSLAKAFPDRAGHIQMQTLAEVLPHQAMNAVPGLIPRSGKKSLFRRSRWRSLRGHG